MIRMKNVTWNGKDGAVKASALYVASVGQAPANWMLTGVINAVWIRRTAVTRTATLNDSFIVRRVNSGFHFCLTFGIAGVILYGFA